MCSWIETYNITASLERGLEARDYKLAMLELSTFVPSVTPMLRANAGSISITASSPARSGVPAVGFRLLCMPVHPAYAVR
jgi:hypothetical protein